jgi:carnitine O-acetyltransferase
MPSYTSSVRTFTMPKSLIGTLASANTSQPQLAKDSGRSMDKAKAVEDGFPKELKEPLASDQPNHKQGITFAAQDKLPKLPIPDLESTTTKYLAALRPLQSPREHADTKHAVEQFLKGEGPELQERLKKYANGKTSYIEQFCKFNFTTSWLYSLTGYARVRLLSEL